MSNALTTGIATLEAFFLSYVACELMKHTGVVDAPDGARKQQARPIPRLGGIGVVAAIMITLGFVALAHEYVPATRGQDWLPGQIPVLWVALAGSLAFTAIGALDDVFGLDAVVKLAMVLAVALAAPLLGVAVPGVETPWGTLGWAPMLIAGSMLWALVFTNAANFMDGSNGLSIGSLAVMFAGLGASHAVVSSASFPPGLIVVIASIAGFLCHNLKGTLYAGDAGAFGLGGLFALLALISGVPVWTSATIALPFLADVLLTLVSRAKRGEALFEAHTDHAYQALIRRGWSHLETALAWWGLSAVCAVAATIGVLGGGALPFAIFWLFVLALTVIWLVAHRSAAGHVQPSTGR